MKKRNYAPKVHITESKRNVRQCTVRIESKTHMWEWSWLPGDDYLVIFVGDDEFEYTLPKWVANVEIAIVEDDRQIIFTEDVTNGA